MCKPAPTCCCHQSGSGGSSRLLVLGALLALAYLTSATWLPILRTALIVTAVAVTMVLALVMAVRIGAPIIATRRRARRQLTSERARASIEPATVYVITDCPVREYALPGLAEPSRAIDKELS